MLKLFGGGGNGSGGSGRARWQGKSFRVQQYHVTVEDVLAEGEKQCWLPRDGRGRDDLLLTVAARSASLYMCVLCCALCYWCEEC